MPFASTLQEWRQAAGMSQAELARRSGTPVDTLRASCRPWDSPWQTTLTECAKVNARLRRQGPALAQGVAPRYPERVVFGTVLSHDSHNRPRI